MTRFRAADEPAFLAVVAELRRWSKSLRPDRDRISVPIYSSSTEDMMTNDCEYNNSTGELCPPIA